MQKQAGVRNSAMELLRIISMIMIIFHHFAVHGGFEFGVSLSATHFWYNFIIMGGKVGVNIFVLISGYYLIDSNKETLNIIKIVKFVGQIWFYSVTIFIIGILTGIIDFRPQDIINTLFPITFSGWWFASTYFVLYLLHPYLNKLLHNISKGLYQKLLLLLVICWSIIPTFTSSYFQSNSLLWFFTLYAIAGYIKLYGANARFSAKHYFVMFLTSSILTYSTSVVIMVAGNKGMLLGSITSFYGQEKLTVLLISLSLFMCFATLRMSYSKIINTLASATFGVYLIHDSNILRSFLWIDLFENAKYQESLFLIPYSIIVVTIVYIVCTLIDLLRINLIEKPCMKIIDGYSGMVVARFENLATSFKNFIFGK